MDAERKRIEEAAKFIEGERRRIVIDHTGESRAKYALAAQALRAWMGEPVALKCEKCGCQYPVYPVRTTCPYIPYRKIACGGRLAGLHAEPRWTE